MSDHVTIVSGGNVLPAAFAALQELGYAVTLTSNGRLCKASNEVRTLVAEDVLLLLGLAKLHETRGNSWGATEPEVRDYLAFDAIHSEAAHERADAWEEEGAVHVLCVSAFGDPVELGEEEARDFAARLNKAIAEAGQNEALHLPEGQKSE